ncbi:MULTISPECIES: aminoacyl-tRNA hydrolase [Trueperella]|uniref:Peptidyl-tRNA hydrolase n=1 Tax=Trueperella abortisuis TaxID=445930 RepID=A0ABT9PH56_9ACTO|nr:MULTISPECIES: aminoacyl-tRNA hydrolase [Trueperella]MCI7306378.1 aminoacyl-tRNA hydrolase [Trueperella sp.]MDP9831719.1 PTH1 family peptidyl-tRNA hydrolase [Trueperella abortisuis]MDY5403908.1 aminoacyl-tRNA hydrolase [Trueperella sp.]
MFAVIGLGNPGPTYENTRHNIGQHVVHELARRAGSSLSVHKQSNTRAASVRVGIGPGKPGEAVVLGVSNGYMNTSGGPVSSLLKYFKIAPEDLIVIHDDLDLPFGHLKLKRGGGSGGHNGLKSITQSLGTQDYVRLRFGIGRPPGRQDPADFVLSPFTSKEDKEVDVLIALAADAVEDVLLHGLDKATMRLHSK